MLKGIRHGVSTEYDGGSAAGPEAPSGGYLP
jgi:hypothetical protein